MTYTRYKPKYAEVFPSNSCPCDNCISSAICKDSYSADASDDLIPNVFYDEAINKFEVDYALYKKTGVLPDRYNPDVEEESYGYDFAAECPYITEFLFWAWVDDDHMIDIDANAINNGYESHIDYIYKSRE